MKQKEPNESSVRYAEDRLKDCRFCHWWGGRNRKCTLGEKNCYYLLPPKETKSEKNRCSGCPYGKTNPCIGFCMKELLQDTRKAREADAHE